MASSPIPAGPANGRTQPHLRNVLGALAVAITDMLAEDAQERGFIPAEHEAIILVGTVEGLSQEDLQRRLGLSQPGTTRLVDRLAERGLIRRTPGRNRRLNALRLTPSGAEEASSALDRRHRVLAPLTDALDEAGQQAAVALVDQMLDALVRSGRSPWRICRQCDQQACEAKPCRCPVDDARLEIGDRPSPNRNDSN